MQESSFCLAGAAARSYWPEGPGCYTEDDFRIDPSLGIAVVSAGNGAIGCQGSAGSKLAVWSLLGELATDRPDMGAAQRLRRGLARADQAVERLTAAWHPGLIKPCTTLAALMLDGEHALVCHAGRCRVSHITPAGLVPLTQDHTLLRAVLESGGNPDEVPARLAQVVTKLIGIEGTDHEILRIPVRAGDRFLISTAELHTLLSEHEIRRCAESGGLAAIRDQIVQSAKVESPERGCITFAIVEIHSGQERGEAVGSSVQPVRSWLYQPGTELPVPPPRWRPLTKNEEAGQMGPEREGPEEHWFSEVWEVVMGSDRTWNGTILR